MARQAERNFTIEGRHIGSKTSLAMVCLPTLLFGIVASFFAGDLLGEDSTGWACFDFSKYSLAARRIFFGNVVGNSCCRLRGNSGCE